MLSGPCKRESNDISACWWYHEVNVYLFFVSPPGPGTSQTPGLVNLLVVVVVVVVGGGGGVSRCHMPHIGYVVTCPTQGMWSAHRAHLGLLFAEGATCKEGVWDPGGWYLKGKEVSPNTPLGPKYFIQDRWFNVRLQLSQTHLGWSAGHTKPFFTFHHLLHSSYSGYVLDALFQKKTYFFLHTSSMVFFDP